MNTYNILLAGSLLVIVSFIFNKISSRTKIPSVLLLIGLGVGFQFLGWDLLTIFDKSLYGILNFLGALGLIFIVLEGSMELSISQKSSRMVLKALVSTLLIFLLTVFFISIVFLWWMQAPLQKALAYAIPLAIISSAVAIPTAVHLSEDKREFVVYESIFSDIIGILVFNYVTNFHGNLGALFTRLSLDVLLFIPSAFLFLILTLLFIHFSTATIKLIPLLAAMIFMYVVGHIFHLPALFLVLVFGVTLRNINWFSSQKISLFLDVPKLVKASRQLKMFVAEFSFLIRTFFFIIFGLTFPLGLFKSKPVIMMGLLIFALIFIVRLVSLRYTIRVNFMQEMLIAPRGLVTVILFFSIPEHLRISGFSDGIIYFVIMASNIVMMAAFAFYRKSYEEPSRSLENVLNKE